MSIAAQLIVNGLIAGSIYALVAAGFSLIYSTNKFMHFAHGATVACGGYLLLVFFSLLKIPFSISVILTIISSALFGLALYQFVYYPLQKKKSSTVILLIASIALLILIENAIQALFGAQVRAIGFVKVSEGISIFGASITPLQIIIICVSIAILILLYVIMRKTSLGRKMRAVADNKELASIVGIHQKRVCQYSFLIGSALAGVAGILIGLEQNLLPKMGTMLIVKGFSGAIIGGIEFVPGAVIGSYLLGLAENLGIWFIPSGYKDAIAFGLLFIFLLLRPQGLFGINRGIKK